LIRIASNAPVERSPDGPMAQIRMCLIPGIGCWVEN
jgi:hypothetical protein